MVSAVAAYILLESSRGSVYLIQIAKMGEVKNTEKLGFLSGLCSLRLFV